MINYDKYKSQIEITHSHICSKLKEVEQDAEWSMRKFYEYHHRLSNLYRWVEDVIEETEGKLERSLKWVKGLCLIDVEKDCSGVQKKLEEVELKLEKIMSKLRDLSNFTFENKEIEDTHYHKFYSDVVRTLKEVEAEKDCSDVQKKLEEVEQELEKIKTCWFENYHFVESELKMIIREVLNITAVVGKLV